MMNNHAFFDETSEQSVVKGKLVSKYFWSWANVMIGNYRKYNDRNGKIAYIDLFAGPGRYKDGTASTPLLVLQRALADVEMRQRLVTIFNDKDENHSQSLEQAIQLLPNVDTLRYKPKVMNQEVGDNIVRMFEQMRMIPTFFFVDPWGYRGLSLRLINAVLKDWGSDCIFFFNYNRINMGLNNEIVEDHMNALFGKERADALRERLDPLSKQERELTIVEELSQALKGKEGRYVLPFRFRTDAGNRTSHHLIFVSKHIRGYTIMKDIMARESSKENQGVPSFEYNPADVRQPLLFELSRPLNDLEEMILSQFAGRTLSMLEVYEEHNVDTPYIKRNYKDTLLQLEAAGKIQAYPAKRRPGTFGDDVMVTFPPIEQE